MWEVEVWLVDIVEEEDGGSVHEHSHPHGKDQNTHNADSKLAEGTIFHKLLAHRQ